MLNNSVSLLLSAFSFFLVLFIFFIFVCNLINALFTISFVSDKEKGETILIWIFL